MKQNAQLAAELGKVEQALAEYSAFAEEPASRSGWSSRTRGRDPMANPEQLELLRRDVGAWNAWRKNQGRNVPDLSDGNLSGANLSVAKLYGADLSYADLSMANLSRGGPRHSKPQRDGPQWGEPWRGGVG